MVHSLAHCNVVVHRTVHHTTAHNHNAVCLARFLILPNLTDYCSSAAFLTRFRIARCGSNNLCVVTSDGLKAFLALLFQQRTKQNIYRLQSKNHWLQGIRNYNNVMQFSYVWLIYVNWIIKELHVCNTWLYNSQYVNHKVSNNCTVSTKMTILHFSYLSS